MKGAMNGGRRRTRVPLFSMLLGALLALTGGVGIANAATTLDYLAARTADNTVNVLVDTPDDQVLTVDLTWNGGSASYTGNGIAGGAGGFWGHDFVSSNFPCSSFDLTVALSNGTGSLGSAVTTIAAGSADCGTPPPSGTTINWTGQGSDNLPCATGGHWVLTGKGITSAVAYVGNEHGAMTKHGQGSFSFDSSGPIDANTKAYAVYQGEANNPQFVLSHCIEGSTSPSPTPTETSESPTPTPTETSATPTPTETSESPTPTPTETSATPTPTETSESPTPTPTKSTATPTPTKSTSTPTPTGTKAGGNTGVGPSAGFSKTGSLSAWWLAIIAGGAAILFGARAYRRPATERPAHRRSH